MRYFIAAEPVLAADEVLEFSDDGWSRTAFVRPHVEALPIFVRRGGVRCFAIRDISRAIMDFLQVDPLLRFLKSAMSNLYLKMTNVTSLISERAADVIRQRDFHIWHNNSSYPRILFKSASGVEIGVRLNFSTSAFNILEEKNAGTLGPI